MELLGLIWKPTIRETMEANTVRLQSQANSEIRVWIRVNKKLSLLQKATCANTFVLSKFGHYNRILPLSKEAVNVVKRKCNSFIWAGKIEKLLMAQTFLPVTEGGLGVKSLHTVSRLCMMKGIWIHLQTQSPNRNTLRRWLVGNSAWTGSPCLQQR